MKVVYQDGDTVNSLLEKLHDEERAELDARYAAGRPFPRRVPLCIEVRYSQFRTFFELLNGRIEQHFLITERTFLGVPVVVIPPDHRGGPRTSKILNGGDLLELHIALSRQSRPASERLS